MTLPAKIRVNTSLPFPALVKGSGPITVAKNNGIWTAGLSFASLGVQSPPLNMTDFLLVNDSVANTFFKMPLSALVGPVSGLPFLNVQSFGAKGNGVTDDTAAIQAAINAASAAGGGLVFMPLGTYVVSNTITLPSNVYLVGAGKGISTIKLTATLAGPIINTTVTSCTNIGVSDFTVDVNAKITGGNGAIFFGNVISKCFMRRISVINMVLFGLVIQGATNFEVSDCDATLPVAVNTQNEGLLCTDAAQNSYGLIANNTFTNTGIEVDGQFIHIVNNTITNWKFGGGITHGPSTHSHDCLIEGNYVAGGGPGPDSNGVYVDGLEIWGLRSTIVGNISANNSGNGVTIGGQNSVCTGNVFYNNGQGGTHPGNVQAGIFVQDNFAGYKGSNSIIDGNSCFNLSPNTTQLYGIVVRLGGGDSLSGVQIGNNSFLGNTTADVVFNTIGQIAFFNEQSIGWQNWSPVMTPTGGTATITTNSARYRILQTPAGKTVQFAAVFSLNPDNGTGALQFNLPTSVSAGAPGGLIGTALETNNNRLGGIAAASGSATATVRRYDGIYPSQGGGSSDFINVIGSYESA